MTQEAIQALNNRRKIIHIDMDCFFAAIEIRENPYLKGLPIAVGGAGARSVVATCSYEARKFGIHSAMPMSVALRRCPKLIIVPVNMPLYKAVSSEIQSLFYEYTDLVEPLSLDEAFLDVTHSSNCSGSATRMAQEICHEIEKQYQLTASAGVAPNKYLAKIGSEWNKPNGCFVILPSQVDRFVEKLSVKQLPGVGRVTAKHLSQLGISRCGDLRLLRLQELKHYFGRFGQVLYNFSRGVDERKVSVHPVRKSLSVEGTFPKDLMTLDACLLELADLYDELIKRMDRVSQEEKLLVKTLFLKMRFNDFVTITIQSSAEGLKKQFFYQLCVSAWERQRRPVRLLGIGVRFFPPDYPEQQALFNY